MNITVKKLPEHELSKNDNAQIMELRDSCFTARQRTYYKQLPHLRYLAHYDDQLVGHAGIDHRMISVDSIPFKIFGIIDLCISKDFRNRGIACKLISEIESIARRSDIDAIILMAQDHRVYLKNGYSLIDNYVCWLRIEEHANYGVAFERLNKEMMVKVLSNKNWGLGLVDLLGYLF